MIANRNVEQAIDDCFFKFIGNKTLQVAWYNENITRCKISTRKLHLFSIAKFFVDEQCTTQILLKNNLYDHVSTKEAPDLLHSRTT